jgi:alkylation response protein AidB-like acyl-CoA dehydrogenase
VVITGTSVMTTTRGLGPQIRGAADWIERERRLPDALVRSLQAAGVFRMPMPHAMGGPELDPITQMRVIEELSFHDGSTGWVAMIGCDGGYYCAYLDDEAAQKLYLDLDSVTSGVLVPSGRAVRTANGYLVTGRWTFASASLHARYFVGGCLVHDAKGPVLEHGRAKMLMAIIPADDITIVDTWCTTGLAGSGSNDVVVEGVEVPDAHTFDLFTGTPSNPAPLYRFRWWMMSKAPAVAIGIARRAIDDLVELAQHKALPPGGTLRDDAFVQAAVGQAQAQVGSAKCWLYAVMDDLWQTSLAGGEPSSAQRAAFRLAITNAFHASRGAVRSMYECGAGSALYRKHPLDRHLRDITTISQHALVNQRSYAEAGRAILGLDPGTLIW